jgi:hypothetical protein
MNNIIKTDKFVKIYRNDGPDRIGHTYLYDIGAEMATNDIFGIFHADMIASPNYIKNMIKHIKPGVVVSGTRIEPPLHPPGPEKYVMNFGMEPEEFDEKSFLNFVSEKEKSENGKTTSGIFAPWIIYKKDFFAISGHDKRVFAPMELEDSDLFNRFLLNGYSLIQSRDAFVYHMTCRGSRFKDGVKITNEIPLGNGNVWKRAQDSQEYTELRQIKFREWWRKWHMDVLHDENMMPIVYPRYDIGFVVKNCSQKELIHFLEPWCDTMFIGWSDEAITSICNEIQKTSKFNISSKIKNLADVPVNDIVIEFDATQLNNNNINFIKQLPLVIQSSGEIGEMEYDIFKLKINQIVDYNKNLINADDSWYINKLR